MVDVILNVITKFPKGTAYTGKMFRHFRQGFLRLPAGFNIYVKFLLKKGSTLSGKNSHPYRVGPFLERVKTILKDLSPLKVYFSLNCTLLNKICFLLFRGVYL